MQNRFQVREIEHVILLTFDGGIMLLDDYVMKQSPNSHVQSLSLESGFASY